MNNQVQKSLCYKRLLLFLTVAFTFSWIFGFINLILVDETANPSLASLLSYIGMFGPALGTLTARLVTKEGFATAYLKVNFKGNALLYGTSVVLPPILCMLACAFVSLVCTGSVRLVYSPVTTLLMLLSNVAFSIPTCSICFGEEFGWRGYLYPRLRELMPPSCAIILCNCIWGVWHLPALLSGLNFGKDIPFFPVSSLLLMCLYCIFMGTLLTYLTERTHSIYPASIFHSVNNTAGANMLSLFTVAQNSQSLPTLYFFLANCIVIIPVCVVCILISRTHESSRQRLKNCKNPSSTAI